MKDREPMGDRLPLDVAHTAGDLDTDGVTEKEAQEGETEGVSDALGDSHEAVADSDRAPLPVAVTVPVTLEVAERHMLGLEVRLPLAEVHMLAEAETDGVAAGEGQEGEADGDSVTLGDSQEGEAEGVCVPLPVCVSEPVPVAVAERHMLGLGERLALAEEHVLGEAVLDRVAEFEGQEEVAVGDSVPLGECQEGEVEGDSVPVPDCDCEPVPQEVEERHRLALEVRLALTEARGLGEVDTDRVPESEGQEEVADGDSVPLGDFQEAVAECDRVPETVGVTEPVPLVVAVRHRLGLAVEQALAEGHVLAEAEPDSEERCEMMGGECEGDTDTVSDGQDGEADGDGVTLCVGVWVAVRQRVEDGEAEPEEVPEAHSDAQLEAVGECVTLLVRLAWLAVKVLVPVAEREGQLAVAETDDVTLGEADSDTVAHGVGVSETVGDAVGVEHSVELLE